MKNLDFVDLNFCQACLILPVFIYEICLRELHTFDQLLLIALAVHAIVILFPIMHFEFITCKTFVLLLLFYFIVKESVGKIVTYF